MGQKVLLIGLRSSSVDFTKWPDLTAEKLEGAFAKILQDLTSQGFLAKWCLTDTGETAEAQVIESLESHAPDVVLIGAGIRTDPDHFLLFERIINIVHSRALGARITFNTSPFDSVEAVRRWSE
jgi:hypothetical protein